MFLSLAVFVKTLFSEMYVWCWYPIIACTDDMLQHNIHILSAQLRLQYQLGVIIKDEGISHAECQLSGLLLLDLVGEIDIT